MTKENTNRYVMTSLWNTPLRPYRPLSPQGGQKTTCGFTLIELLVVVLIIGILAAVALPRYQLAVAKSRITSMVPLLTSISNAQEVYYAQEGHYASKIAHLDIDIPNQCLLLKDTPEEYYACGSDFLLNLASNSDTVTISYCPHEATGNQCIAKRELRITRTLNYSTGKGKSFCAPAANSALGAKICHSLEGFELYTN